MPAGQRVYSSIIADGIYCHKYSVSMAHHLHPAGLIVITNAMAAGFTGEITISVQPSEGALAAFVELNNRSTSDSVAVSTGAAHGVLLHTVAHTQHYRAHQLRGEQAAV